MSSCCGDLPKPRSSESAEEAREKFRARLAFDDYHEMLAHPEHVYAEWPLIYNSNGSSTSSGRAEPAASPLMVSLLNQHFEMASSDSRMKDLRT